MSIPVPANDRQVGGNHYKGVKLQHWDFAALSGLGYFEGQITKYISRHSKKNGLQDVEKAGHFLDKLIELYEQGQPPMHSTEHAGRTTEFIESNDLGNLEAIVVRAVASWHKRWELVRAREAVTRLAAGYAPKSPLTPEQEAAVDDTAGLGPQS